MEIEDVDSDEVREDDTFQVSDSDDEFEFDKPKPVARKKAAAKTVIDSSDDSPPKRSKKAQPLASVSSDDLFDSLIGKATPKKDDSYPQRDEESPQKAAAADPFTIGISSFIMFFPRISHFDILTNFQVWV